MESTKTNHGGGSGIKLEPSGGKAGADAPRAIPPDNKILYFCRDREGFAFLSHFYPAAIRLDGETWLTVEHYYQAQKSDDPAYRDAIRSAKNPEVAKRLASQPLAPGNPGRGSWFRKNGSLPRRDWHAVKLDIMRRADWAKFTQNHGLASLLLETGDAELIEDSPAEPFWGTGPDGEGENWSGRVLMEVRERLRQERMAERDSSR